LTTRDHKKDIEAKSTDYGLSVARITKRQPLKRIERDLNEQNKLVFVFENTETLKEITEAYWNHQLEVDALEFYNNLKLLKNRIREELYNG